MDNLADSFIISEKQSTLMVNNKLSRVNNGICKKISVKLSINTQHIILFISVLKKNKKKIKIYCDVDKRGIEKRNP